MESGERIILFFCPALLFPFFFSILLIFTRIFVLFCISFRTMPFKVSLFFVSDRTQLQKSVGTCNTRLKNICVKLMVYKLVSPLRLQAIIKNTNLVLINCLNYVDPMKFLPAMHSIFLPKSLLLWLSERNRCTWFVWRSVDRIGYWAGVHYQVEDHN